MRRKSTAQSDIKYSCGTFCMGKNPGMYDVFGYQSL